MIAHSIPSIQPNIKACKPFFLHSPDVFNCNHLLTLIEWFNSFTAWQREGVLSCQIHCYKQRNELQENNELAKQTAAKILSSVLEFLSLGPQ